MMNIRWIQLISYITCSRLANLTTNGISWIFSMKQQWASNHLSHANLWCTRRLRPCMHFEVKALEKTIFQPLAGIPGKPRDLSWVSWPQVKPYIFGNPISQSFQARRYWVSMSEYEIPACRFVAMPQYLLAYDWYSGALENPLHMSWVHFDSSSTAHLLFPFGTEILWVISSISVRIWDTAHLFGANLPLWLAFDRTYMHWKGLSPYPYDRSIPAYLAITVAMKSV